MDKRYTALRIIATIYKIIGVLIAILTVVAIVVMVVGLASGSRQLSGYGMGMFGTEMIAVAILASLLFGGLGALGVFAVGEALYLLINLEENTRYTAIILRDRQPQ